jgi:magnesium chelatase family protein
VLDVLRQPLEEHAVSICRAAHSVTFPACFMLAAAMNPCNCGFSGDATRRCSCTPPMIDRYRARISGPLLDRIDLHIPVPAVKYRDLVAEGDCEDSAAIRARILAARDTQRQRLGSFGVACNAQMVGRAMRRF